MKKTAKPYWEMTTAELREATKEFDAPCAFLQGKPLDAEGRRLHALARQRACRRGDPGAKTVWISLDRGLLAKADRVAHTLQITRSELIAHTLRAALRRPHAA